jgi:hypothetical protein
LKAASCSRRIFDGAGRNTLAIETGRQLMRAGQFRDFSLCGRDFTAKVSQALCGARLTLRSLKRGMSDVVLKILQNMPRSLKLHSDGRRAGLRLHETVPPLRLRDVTAAVAHTSAARAEPFGSPSMKTSGPRPRQEPPAVHQCRPQIGCNVACSTS